MTGNRRSIAAAADAAARAYHAGSASRPAAPEPATAAPAGPAQGMLAELSGVLAGWIRRAGELRRLAEPLEAIPDTARWNIAEAIEARAIDMCAADVAALINRWAAATAAART